MKKSVISIISALAGAATGAGVAGRLSGEALEKTKAMSEKHLALFLMMNQWVKVKQSGKNVGDYLSKNGFNRIAVYGMSYVGETLVEELKGTDVQIVYGIDKKSDGISLDIDVVPPEDKLDEVDAVVVTAITYFDEIEEKLSRKLSCPIISLEDILYAIDT